MAGVTSLVREKIVSDILPQRLLSYYYLGAVENSCLKIMKYDVENDVDIFIDSGAFSALAQGKEIKLDNYIKFIKENEDDIDVYANLDVIGDAEATLENQKEMQRAGLTPLPCFHFGEPIKFLHHYLDNYDYIALGGVASGSRKHTMSWLNDMFDKHICDSDGEPKVKVHGFGITALDWLLRFPWYSVDSSSWNVTARVGNIYVPKVKNCHWVYNHIPDVIPVSTQSSSLSTKKHATTLSPNRKKQMMEYLAQKGYILGQSKFRTVSEGYKLKKKEAWADKKKAGKTLVEKKTIVGLANDYKIRDGINVEYFKDVQTFLSDHPRRFKAEHKRETFNLE